MNIRVVRAMNRGIASLLLSVLLAACGSGSASNRAAAQCGDGRVDLGEQCDGADLAGRNCSNFGLDPHRVLRCAADCTFDISACNARLCGNGVIDDLSGPNQLCEECDGLAFGGRSCAGFQGIGTLTCKDDCLVDRASCDEVCGNGRLEPGEECEFNPDTFQTILPDGVSCESLGFGGGGPSLFSRRRRSRNTIRYCRCRGMPARPHWLRVSSKQPIPVRQWRQGTLREVRRH